MKINKIIKLKNNKYKIIIGDETITTYDNVILENNLLYKEKIDKSLYEKVLIDTEFYDSYNRAVKYISKRKRSEKGVVDYLLKSNLSKSDIDKIIIKLKGVNLINDEEYCKSYINDKIYLSKDGLNKIKYDLISENIPIDLIENELAKIDNDIYENRLSKMILKRINSNKKYSNDKLKQKILYEMINLGYDKEKILKIIDNNLSDDNETVKKEIIQLYNKYSKKYNKEQLNKKIIQVMLSRGFSYDKIISNIKEEDY